MSTADQSTARRHLRLGVVPLPVMGGTDLIGFGGLAAWTAVTQKDNGRFSTSAVHQLSLSLPVSGPASDLVSTCTASFVWRQASS